MATVMFYANLPKEEQLAFLARLRTLARTLAAEAEAELADRWAEESAPYRVARPTRDIRQYVEEFLAELSFAGLSPSTITGYRATLRRFTAFCAEQNLDPFQLTGPQARDFRNLLAGRGLSPSTVNAALSHLKKFYEYLVDESLLTGNPVIRRRLRMREPDRLPRFLPPEEKEKVLAWFRDHAPPNVALAFRTMFASGLRLGECVALQPGDLLVRDNAYLLHVRLGKGAKGRLAPIVDRDTALELFRLARERPPGETLFGLSAPALAGHARDCAAATNIEFHAHRCRHTFATELLRRGVPVDVVQEALGHADIHTTRTYARTAPQAITKLGTHRRDY